VPAGNCSTIAACARGRFSAGDRYRARAGRENPRRIISSSVQNVRHQHTGGRLHGAPHRLLHGPGPAHSTPRARHLISNDECQLLPAPARRDWGVRGGLPATAAPAIARRHTLDRESPPSRSMRRRSTPAIMREDLEMGCRESDRRTRCPYTDRPWAGRFPQHVQPGRMIDLAVDQYDPGDGGCHAAPRRLQNGVRP